MSLITYHQLVDSNSKREDISFGQIGQIVTEISQKLGSQVPGVTFIDVFSSLTLSNTWKTQIGNLVLVSTGEKDVLYNKKSATKNKRLGLTWLDVKMDDVLFVQVLKTHADVTEDLSDHWLTELDVQLLDVSEVTRAVFHL